MRIIPSLAILATIALLSTTSLSRASNPMQGDQNLAQKLADTYWSWPDLNHIGDEKGWFRFNANGTVTAGWNGKKHHWNPADGLSVEFDIRSTSQGQHQLFFNSDLTEAEEDRPFVNGKPAGSFIFHRLTGPSRSLVYSPLTPSPELKTESKPLPALQVLSEEAPNVSNWALSPLDDDVPDGIRQNITLLRENLLDEASGKPAAGPQAYDAAAKLCNALISALDDRDKTRTRYGYRVDQENANIVVTSQALEADRNHRMSWPQYRREEDQRKEISREQNSRATEQEDLPKLEWAQRCDTQRIWTISTRATAARCGRRRNRLFAGCRC
jgi:hypothetical protein